MRAAQSVPFGSPSEVPRTPSSVWSRVDLSRPEDLGDAVLGAGLTATQLSCRLTGSLAFAEDDGIVYSSGWIHGRVALAGPLSETMVTLGVGLNLAAGTRHWLNEVTTGDFGVFLPGDEHDSVYMPGSLYATVSLPAERLEEEAARRAGLVLDHRRLGGTGVDTKKVALGKLLRPTAALKSIHSGRQDRLSDATTVGDDLLDIVISHLGRQPCVRPGRRNPEGRALIVARARAFIHDNLHQPLSVDSIAAAARTSRRSLQRAFREALGESPQSYVCKLRLHRIRHDLATESEARCTIATVANRWGISELGRLSGRYRDLFGELPSQTLSRGRTG